MQKSSSKQLLHSRWTTWSMTILGRQHETWSKPWSCSLHHRPPHRPLLSWGSSWTSSHHHPCQQPKLLPFAGSSNALFLVKRCNGFFGGVGVNAVVGEPVASPLGALWTQAINTTLTETSIAFVEWQYLKYRRKTTHKPFAFVFSTLGKWCTTRKNTCERHQLQSSSNITRTSLHCTTIKIGLICRQSLLNLATFIWDGTTQQQTWMLTFVHVHFGVFSEFKGNW